MRNMAGVGVQLWCGPWDSEAEIRLRCGTDCGISIGKITVRNGMCVLAGELQMGLYRPYVVQLLLPVPNVTGMSHSACGGGRDMV